MEEELLEVQHQNKKAKAEFEASERRSKPSPETLNSKPYTFTPKSLL